MYLATKGGSSCRIPKRKAGYYKSMGYSLENLDEEVGASASPTKKKKTDEKEPASQEDVNPANN